MSMIQAQASEQRENDPTAMIRSQSPEFFKVLPAFVNRTAWLRMAESAVVKTPEISNAAKRDMGALMRALMECARLGHMPNTDDYYLTVRSGVVQGAEGWKGMVQRILRSGVYQKVVAEVVYDFEVEDFDFNPNTDDRPTHRIKHILRTDDTTPVMAYAYAIDHQGRPSKVALAEPRYLTKVKKMSRGGVWDKWDEAMYVKTALRMLIDFVDNSSEDRRVIPEAVVDEAIPEPVETIDTPAELDENEADQ